MIKSIRDLGMPSSVKAGVQEIFDKKKHLIGDKEHLYKCYTTQGTSDIIICFLTEAIDYNGNYSFKYLVNYPDPPPATFKQNIANFLNMFSYLKANNRYLFVPVTSEYCNAVILEWIRD